jgi:hypothetical protein
LVDQELKGDIRLHFRTWWAIALALLAVLGPALVPNALLAQADGLKALDGEWICVECEVPSKLTRVEC